MALRRLNVTGMLLTLCLVMACGGEQEPEESEPEPIESEEYVDRLDDELAESACTMLYADCPDAAVVLKSVGALNWVVSEEECVEEFDALEYFYGEGTVDAESTREMLEDGEVAFDEEGARECIDQLQEGREEDSCWMPPAPLLEACLDPLDGQVEPGEECSGDLGCVSRRCEAIPVDEDTCEYECAEMPELFEEGDSCNPVSSSEICDPSEGLACESLGDGVYECLLIGAHGEGESCSADKLCGEGLLCDARECAEVSTSSLGEDCRTDGDSVPCKADLICLPDDGSFGEGECVEAASEGEACESNRECELDLYCDVQNQECAVPDAQEGDSCSSGGECVDGLYCDMGSCHEQKEEGATCTYSHECQGDMYCTNGPGQEGECYADDSSDDCAVYNPGG